MSQKERILTGILLFIISFLTTIDIIEDVQEGTNLRHLGLDLGIAVASIVMAVFLVWRLSRDKDKILTLSKEKKILEEIAQKHLNKTKFVVEGLSTYIDQEFTNWNLSNAEREVALLMIKGLSASEIAEIRASTEKTVRHQSTAVYKKAGVKGRGELQAYFLEDLL